MRDIYASACILIVGLILGSWGSAATPASPDVKIDKPAEVRKIDENQFADCLKKAYDVSVKLRDEMAAACSGAKSQHPACEQARAAFQANHSMMKKTVQTCRTNATAPHA